MTWDSPVSYIKSELGALAVCRLSPDRQERITSRSQAQPCGRRVHPHARVLVHGTVRPPPQCRQGRVCTCACTCAICTAGTLVVRVVSVHPACKCACAACASVRQGQPCGRPHLLAADHLRIRIRAPALLYLDNLVEERRGERRHLHHADDDEAAQHPWCSFPGSETCRLVPGFTRPCIGVPCPPCLVAA